MTSFLRCKLTFFLTMAIFSLAAQNEWLINYTFEEYQGSYTEITEGNVIASGPGIDQQVYNNIALPFPFSYNGNDYDKIALHPNGFLVFGGPIEEGYHFKPISDNYPNSPNNLISVMGLDMVSIGDNSEIRCQVSEQAPDRIFTVQWKEFSYWSAVGEDEYSFQIKLHETSDDIELVYGEVVSTSIWTSNPQVGLRGESNQNFNNRQTTSDWTNSIAGTENTAWCELSSSVFPPAGYVFKYIYNEAATFDAGVSEITGPVGPLFQAGVHDIEVKVKNYGIEELTSASIAWQVSNSNVEYFSWSGGPVPTGEEAGPIIAGSYDFQSPGGNIRAWTELPNGQPDPNPLNDSAYGSVSVNPYCLEPMDCEWVELDDFSLALLNHQNSGCNYSINTFGYGDFTLEPTLTTELFRGSFYSWTAGTSSWGNLGIWIDFDNNFEFSNSECIYVSSAPFETSSPDDSFTLSDTVAAGSFRMRVRFTASNEEQLTAYDACTEFWEGETHDYTVTIMDVSSPPECATVPNPMNGASGIQLNPILTCSSIGATSYDVYFGTESPPNFVINQSEPIYAPGILRPNTTYYWQLIPRNSFGPASDCEIWEFTTGENIAYCTDLYFDGCFEWGDEIEDFILADIEHLNSGCTGNGYGFFPEYQTELDLDGNYTWYADVASWEYLGMWIDYNRDGDFDDTGEFVYGNAEPTGYNAGINAWGDFTLPEELELGEYRLRIRLVWDESLEVDESCEKFVYGETHDYSITVHAPASAPDCVENPVPENGAIDIPTNEGMLYWEGKGASEYDLYFGIGTLEFIGTQDSASFNPGILLPNTTYQWKIIPKNILGEPEDCQVWTFTTNDDIVYCENGLYSTQEFYNCEFGDEIDDFHLADINHTGSGCSWAGYGDFTENTNLETDLERGFEYPWSASIGLNFQDWMIIWIDFNKDGEFDDGFECVFQSDDFIPSAMSSTITIPEEVPLGFTRLRARIKAQYPQMLCDEACEYFLFGEVHDYTVNIIDPSALPECSHSPDPVDGAVNIPIIDINLTWAEIANANSYDVYFGTNSLEFVGNQTSNNFDPGELEQLITYQWKVVPQNENGPAEDCETWTFTTGFYEDISTADNDARISIYPNPSLDGKFQIRFDSSYPGPLKLRVIDSFGKTALLNNITDKSKAINLQIPVAHPGIYYIQVIQEHGGITCKKLIVF